MDIKKFESYIKEQVKKYPTLDINDLNDLDSCMRFFVEYKKLIKDRELETVKYELVNFFNIDINHRKDDQNKKMTPNQMYIEHQSKFVNSLYSAFILNK